jgi:hypothetical protein
MESEDTPEIVLWCLCVGWGLCVLVDTPSSYSRRSQH